MGRKLPVKPLDIAIVALSIGLTGISAFYLYNKPNNSSQFLIQGQTQSWIFPMDAEETINVNGPLGITVVRIQGKEAWVETSPCVNKSCVAQGHALYQGAWIACLPNCVFLVIEGNNEQGIVPDTIVW